MLGGVYLDNDLEVNTALDGVILPSDTFISCWSASHTNSLTHEVDNKDIVFQAFLAAAKGSPVIARGLELFRAHISGGATNRPNIVLRRGCSVVRVCVCEVRVCAHTPVRIASAHQGPPQN